MRSFRAYLDALEFYVFRLRFGFVGGFAAVLLTSDLISAKDYGLFLADEDVKKGVWLEPGRNLEYYILRNGVRTVFKVCRLSMFGRTHVFGICRICWNTVRNFGRCGCGCLMEHLRRCWWTTVNPSPTSWSLSAPRSVSHVKFPPPPPLFSH